MLHAAAALRRDTADPDLYATVLSANLADSLPPDAERVKRRRSVAQRMIVSVMAFRYDVCDIDFYTEAAVGIAVKPARHGGLGLLDLVTGLKNDSLHSYVLSLPVNTEIAQVRGHDGYGFPKWVTGLDVDIDTARTSARVANERGGLDLALSAPTPKQTARPTGAHVSTLTSYTTIDGAWHSTTSQINMLSSGTTRFPRGLDLRLGEGRMSDDLRSLKPVRTIQLDVTTEGQLALHMPVPTSIQDRS